MQPQSISSGSTDQFESSHARWQALTHRTPAAHSSFLYGVKSTKIYCRPTCSARLARRANVVFYDTEEQARREGFRPCKRCRPDDSNFVGDGEEVVTRVIALLRIRKDDVTMKGGLKELAQEVGVTPSYLCRVFKKTMKITVGQYMREFEKPSSDTETDTSSSFRSPSAFDSDTTDPGAPLTPATTVASPSAPVETLKGGPMEVQVGHVEDALDLDLDLDFDFDEWLWSDDVTQINTNG